ncbi:MAG: methylated-DNA--[protein]-cysteine S-methyltransferase [Clostridiales bacterium]|jgi:methylated-DNA-[protein]-cysteine S-methyltransferase|nr:methylated-DNA--[protein]-cysteine S-methyltransferase [Clostridiales bacterium]
MVNLYYYKTAIGDIGIAENGNAITNLFFKRKKQVDNQGLKETDLLREASKQLNEYFMGNRFKFDLPLFISGTEFQQKVWRALESIPYGETRSYKQIAEAIGNPKACRAVGMANNRNPISIIIPCHRVIGSTGRLVGYGGGLDIKEKLLQLERDNVR